MRIHEQRDLLLTATATAELEARDLYSALVRKTACPYGDGTRSNMVNVETDVYPRLVNLITELNDARRALESA